MGVHGFDELKGHIGHDVVVVGYGQDEVKNVAIECETCGCVLKDYNVGESEGDRLEACKKANNDLSWACDDKDLEIETLQMEIARLEGERDKYIDRTIEMNDWSLQLAETLQDVDHTMMVWIPLHPKRAQIKEMLSRFRKAMKG